MTADLPVADLHVDVLGRLVDQGHHLADPGGRLDLPRLLASPVRLVVLAVFVPPHLEAAAASTRARAQAEAFWREMAAHPDALFPVLARRDLRPPGERVACLLAAEGLGYLPGPEALAELAARGVRAASLTWNEPNRFGGGCLAGEGARGLTPSGEDLLAEMAARGVLPDLSHASAELFWDVLARTRGPVFVSHAGAHAVRPHPRNLQDDQIRALAERGGVVGVVAHGPFLVANRPARLDDVLAHLAHLLDTGGEDLPAFGSDFEGTEDPPEGLTGVEHVARLAEAVADRFGARRAEKILYRNAERLFTTALG